MIGRIAYALALGVPGYITARRGAAATPARGDPDAPDSLALTVTEAFLAAQINGLTRTFAA